MEDLGEEYVERVIERLTKRINKIYHQAFVGVSKKADKYFSHFKDQYEKKLKEYNLGIITDKEFADWYSKAVLLNNKWSAMRKELGTDLLNANKMAVSIINGELPAVFAENYNFASYMIDKELKAFCGFTIYDQNTVVELLKGKGVLWIDLDEPKCLLWNEQHIQSAVLQATLQGESIPQLARRLRQVTDMDTKQSIRTARSTMTTAQSMGRQASYEQAIKLGIKTKKQWLAVHDERTRSSHIYMDGQIVDVDKPFLNYDDVPIRYPGDRTAPPGEYYNCRCRMVSALEGMDNDISDKVQIKGDISYEEWKQQGIDQLEKARARKQEKEAQQNG